MKSFTAVKTVPGDMKIPWARACGEENDRRWWW